MKQTKAIIFIIALLSFIIGTIYICNNPNNITLIDLNSPKDSIIQINPWQPYKSIQDTNYIYRVTWQEKYGNEKTQLAMVIFKNTKTNDYKLVAPNIDTEILSSNLNTIDFIKIKKSK